MVQTDLLLEEENLQMLQQNDDSQDNTNIRVGNWKYACFHSTAAIVGAGALVLPWAFSYLGWLGAAAVLLLAFMVSLFAAENLIQLHEQDGKRFDTYTHLGQHILGPSLGWILPLFQQLTMVGAIIACTVLGAQCLQYIYELSFVNSTQTPIQWWVLGYGVVVLILSQLPDLNSLRFVSLLGVFMVIGFTGIAFISSTIHLTQNEEPVDYKQRSMDDLTQVFTVGTTLGNVMFNFGGLSALMEIQATLPSPSQNAMRLGITGAYIIGLVVYSLVGFVGYAAFGSEVQDNILVSVAKPNWLVVIANVMVVVSISTAIQIYLRIVFIAIEYKVLEGKRTTKHLIGRAVLRIVVVTLMVTVAAYIPYFSTVQLVRLDRPWELLSSLTYLLLSTMAINYQQHTVLYVSLLQLQW
eukprot:TRINITY_DN657_c2_g1_i8.p1 TRINITY_DN657_c2_g1~~TRINITY_DN657_c2_g1_i8.p1  ORF type:complete len:410 (-),score=13.82 TRINITY_DN657_c2_g1_i8:856-2085(-)